MRGNESEIYRFRPTGFQLGLRPKRQINGWGDEAAYYARTLLEARLAQGVRGYPPACKQIGSNDVAICQNDDGTRGLVAALVFVCMCDARGMRSVSDAAGGTGIHTWLICIRSRLPQVFPSFPANPRR